MLVEGHYCLQGHFAGSKIPIDGSLSDRVLRSKEPVAASLILLHDSWSHTLLRAIRNVQQAYEVHDRASKARSKGWKIEVRVRSAASQGERAARYPSAERLLTG
jgi:hypothetical protein